MTRPSFDTLPPDLQELQKRWLELPRKEQDVFYAREFAEPFAQVFAGRPLVGAPEGFPRPRVLISVLGFSWQPVALMAAWCRPERMLVIGTDESFALRPAGEDILSLIARVGGIPLSAVESVRVGDPPEAEIYRHVRDFLTRSNVQARQVFIDPTGGKKSMSAAAALAGYVLGAPLVYVDYAAYDENRRIPVAGTEYPRLLANPLEVMGDLELREILRAFNRGDFHEAENWAKRLVVRLYEPREVECLALLARGYAAWDAFRFDEALDSLRKAKDHLDRFAEQGRWSWAQATRKKLSDNLAVLEALARTREKPATLEEGIPLLAWYLAAAERLLGVGKVSLAVLLTYAAVERYVVLCLRVEHGLDPAEPEYAKVLEKLDRSAYHEAGRRLVGKKKYQPCDPKGPLMFVTGAQLLAALDPERMPPGDLGCLGGLAFARNRCEYEHGFLPKPPRPEDAKRFLDAARRIVARLQGEASFLDEAIENCRFPTLEVE
jgi:CRISPR-associated protein (TIGR02710 family)